MLVRVLYSRNGIGVKGDIRRLDPNIARQWIDRGLVEPATDSDLVSEPVPEIVADTPADPAPEVKPKRRRGRPKKTEASNGDTD